jgi:hypothetical protein
MELEVRLHGTQAGGTLALEERDRAINHISRRASLKRTFIKVVGGSDSRPSPLVGRPR